MTTRAAAATLSLRTKEALIRILFRSSNSYQQEQKTTFDEMLKSHGNGKEAPTNLSYHDLKKIYLIRIHELHPDKRRGAIDENIIGVDRKSVTRSSARESGISPCTKEFVELQSAWERYESIVKAMKIEDSGSGMVDEANFTMFGVGCSFADNDSERSFRDEIMDQASKGWIPSGTIAMSHTDGKTNKQNARLIRLTSDDWFDEFSDNDQLPSTTNTELKSCTSSLDSKRSRRSLVSEQLRK